MLGRWLGMPGRLGKSRAKTLNGDVLSAKCCLQRLRIQSVFELMLYPAHWCTKQNKKLNGYTNRSRIEHAKLTSFQSLSLKQDVRNCKYRCLELTKNGRSKWSLPPGTNKKLSKAENKFLRLEKDEFWQRRLLPSGLPLIMSPTCTEKEASFAIVLDFMYGRIVSLRHANSGPSYVKVFPIGKLPMLLLETVQE
jgi:hypothetical protein